VVGFCEHGDESSGSIKKARYVFDKPSDSFSNNILLHGVIK
jgi:hypothetical protein